ncbi:MAG: hypothetical protein KAG45_03030, partial [Methyloprofundus sp.]|nr:hypothetical protein [Methyloprofundus sp.]
MSLSNFLLRSIIPRSTDFSSLRSEDLIIPESMTQVFGFTVVLGKQAHSRLCNCFYSAAVEPKDKSDSGIIEFS